MTTVIQDILKNRFRITLLTPANPPAGTEMTVTVPAGKIYIPISFYGVFIADATVATRVPRLQYRNGATVFAQVRGGVSIIASGASAVFGNKNSVPLTLGTGGIEFTVPEIPVEAGEVIATAVQNLQAGDTWSALALKVMEIDITEVF